MNGEPIKHEVDKATGAIFVDRFMSTAPCTTPQLWLHPEDTLCVMAIRRCAGVVAGAADAGRGGTLPSDRHAQNAVMRPAAMKLLAVPVDKLTSIYRNVHSP